jgi:hypothetical protein
MNLDSSNKFVDPVCNIDEYYQELRNKLQITNKDAFDFLTKTRIGRTTIANRIFQKVEKYY